MTRNQLAGAALAFLAGLLLAMTGAAQNAIETYERGRSMQAKAAWDSSSAYFREAAHQFYPNPAVAPRTQEDLTAVAWRLRCRTEIGRNYVSKGQAQRGIDSLYDALREARVLMDTNSTTVARIYNSIGQAHENQQNSKAALYHYQTAYRVLKAAYGKDNESTALTAYNIGVSFDKLARYDSALYWKTRAMETLRQATGEKTEDLADVYSSIGVTHDNRGDYENALLFYQKAQAIVTELWGDKDPRLADLYNKMGVAYDNKGDAANASRYKTSALRMREQSGDPMVVESYLNLGVSFVKQGKYAEALVHYNKARRLQEESGDQLGLAKTYTNIGALFYEEGSRRKSQSGRADQRDLDSTVKYHQAALDLRMKALGHKHPDVAGSYNNLAAAYFQLGEAYRPALIAFQKAMIASVADFNDTSFAKNPSLDQVISETRLLTALEGKANALYNLARTENANNYGSRRYKTALATAYRSIELATELIQLMRRGFRSEEAQIDLAERSFVIFEQALQLALTLENTGLSNTEDLPNFYEKTFSFSEQIKGGVLQQALMERQAKITTADVPRSVLEIEQKLVEDLAMTQKNLAAEMSKGARGDKNLVRQLLNQKFDLKAAHDSLVRSLEENYPDYYQRKYDTRFGTLKQVKQMLADAQQQMRQAQGGPLGEKEKQALARAISETDALLAESNRNRFEQQQQKRRNFILAHVRMALSGLMKQSVQQQIADLRRIAETSFLKEQQLRSRSILQSADTALARGQVQTAQRTLESLADLAPTADSRAQVEQALRLELLESSTYQQLAAAERLLFAEPSVYAAQKVIKTQQERSRNPQALVEYLTGDSSLYVFYITEKDFRILQLPGTYFIPAEDGSGAYQQVRYAYSREKLDEEVRKLRASILKQNKPEYVQAAQSVYRTVLQPLERYLKLDRISQLILVPDGSLLYVPFEALLTHKPDSEEWRSMPYLLTSYRVSYTYNYNLVGDVGTGTTGKRSLLALAPVFAEADQQTQFGGKIVAPLPASEKELNAIAELFRASGRDDYSVYIGVEARKTRIKGGEASQYRMLHMATHGFVYPEDPVRSGVLLYPDKGEEGMLYSGELAGLNLDADLVVLSACETGLGKIRKGEGIIGLTRGFLFAGARNVVVTLWPVADESTSRLMTEFYRTILQKNASFPTALSEAKMLLIRQGDFAAPFYWAPFILVD